MSHQLSHTVELLVRFNEADPLGIVWHGHYIRYFEDGREAFGKEYGMGYSDFFNHGIIIPIVHAECNYKRSLKFGDSVKVETVFIPCVAAKIIFNYNLYKASDDTLVATGTTTQVFLDKESQMLQLNTPAFFEAWKRKMGVA